MNDTLGSTVWSRSDGNPTSTRVGVEEVLPARVTELSIDRKYCQAPLGFAEIRAHECAVVLIQAVRSPSAGLWTARSYKLWGGFKVRGQVTWGGAGQCSDESCVWARWGIKWSHGAEATTPWINSLGLLLSTLTAPRKSLGESRKQKIPMPRPIKSESLGWRPRQQWPLSDPGRLDSWRTGEDWERSAVMGWMVNQKSVKKQDQRCENVDEQRREWAGALSIVI